MIKPITRGHPAGKCQSQDSNFNLTRCKDFALNRGGSGRQKRRMLHRGQKDTLPSLGQSCAQRRGPAWLPQDPSANELSLSMSCSDAPHTCHAPFLSSYCVLHIHLLKIALSCSIKIHYSVPQASLRHISQIQDT